MPRTTHFPYCLSLRLAANMQAELDNISYEFRTSRAQFIRRAIHRAIADSYRQDQPFKNIPFHGGVQ